MAITIILRISCINLVFLRSFCQFFLHSRTKSIRRFFYIVLSSFICGHAFADQYGVPFWLSGQYASMSAIPPVPGWSLVTLGNLYRGSVNQTPLLPIAEVNEKSTTATALFQPGYAFKDRLFGATPYISVAMGPGVAHSTISAPIYGSKVSQTSFGFSDITPFGSLSWNEGTNNFMIYLTGNIPTGTFNKNRLSNIGIGHSAIDSGAAYTFFNPETGWEFSALSGITYNFTNAYTNYKNGVDFHTDSGASRWLSKNWQIGIAGYVYYQLSNDSGGGDIIGGNRSRVAAIGPQIGYLFQDKSGILYINLRGYQEFWTQNRTQGQNVFLTMSYTWNP
ncbi:transporter [Rhizobiales bacterium TNE-4]|nr:transporter [Rhizobiales bacterium TNE-4]MBV1829004.1 transporter [Rhizobiales bacterium TNE-4]